MSLDANRRRVFGERGRCRTFMSIVPDLVCHRLDLNRDDFHLCSPQRARRLSNQKLVCRLEMRMWNRLRRKFHDARMSFRVFLFLFVLFLLSFFSFFFITDTRPSTARCFVGFGYDFSTFSFVNIESTRNVFIRARCLLVTTPPLPEVVVVASSLPLFPSPPLAPTSSTTNNSSSSFVSTFAPSRRRDIVSSVSAHLFFLAAFFVLLFAAIVRSSRKPRRFRVAQHFSLSLLLSFSLSRVGCRPLLPSSRVQSFNKVVVKVVQRGQEAAEDPNKK